MNCFPQILRTLREECGLSQEQLGQIIGVKRYSIYTYEKGKSCPDMEGLIALAEYFQVSIDYLVGRTDNREINR